MVPEAKGGWALKYQVEAFVCSSAARLKRKGFKLPGNSRSDHAAEVYRFGLRRLYCHLGERAGLAGWSAMPGEWKSGWPGMPPTKGEATLISQIEQTAGGSIGDPLVFQQMMEPALYCQPRLKGVGSAFQLVLGMKHHRKSSGSYFTPVDLVEFLLDTCLDKLGRHSPGGNNPQLPSVHDPACGSGRFLVRAALKMGSTRNLTGCDTDPLAVDLCRFCLFLASRNMSQMESIIQNIQVSDGLLEGFIDHGIRSGIVIGNPPFVNNINRGVPGARLAKYRRAFPGIKGAADLSYFFLAKALERIGPQGVVGLVLPRPVLNASSLDELRANLPFGLKPLMIFAPESHSLFPGASVYITALVIGKGNRCRVSFSPGLEASIWQTGVIRGSNWWAEARRIVTGSGSDNAGSGAELGSAFQVKAGLTADEAYRTLKCLGEMPGAQRFKLVTTGLIDPGKCWWGERKCRFLKTNWVHPALDEALAMQSGLGRRIELSLRPKIVVAGLAKRIECFLDKEGMCFPSVGTFVVYHPEDDLAMLRKLADFLSSPAATEAFLSELGANAMGGGNTTMKKQFLLQLRLPADF